MVKKMKKLFSEKELEKLTVEQLEELRDMIDDAQTAAEKREAAERCAPRVASMLEDIKAVFPRASWKVGRIFSSEEGWEFETEWAYIYYNSLSESPDDTFRWVWRKVGSRWDTSASSLLGLEHSVRASLTEMRNTVNELEKYF